MQGNQTKQKTTRAALRNAHFSFDVNTQHASNFKQEHAMKKKTLCGSVANLKPDKT